MQHFFFILEHHSLLLNIYKQHEVWKKYLQVFFFFLSGVWLRQCIDVLPIGFGPPCRGNIIKQSRGSHHIFI